MLDPHLKDGVHEWRDGKRLIKEGVKVYIEGTDTLAGRCALHVIDLNTNARLIHKPEISSCAYLCFRIVW